MRFRMFWTRRISSTGKRSRRRRVRTWHRTNHHRSNATCTEWKDSTTCINRFINSYK
uniref:Uncharacterized protein n=1 Tax=Brassica oleracea TaxID=3712 RepID=A0A3P6E9R0_BRAOL|nr:unnamed protein product [Brassica oleracea]